ncbi:MAG: grasp-with-spasm system ATP-grasp peptide maturase [Crocinitomicaceae bacterium]
MKKHVIIASSSFENSTDRVMEWIDYYGGKPTRINALDDFFYGEFSLSFEKKKDPVSIWFRRTDRQGEIPKVDEKHVHKSQTFKKGRVKNVVKSLELEMKQDNASLAYHFWKSFDVTQSVGSLANSVPDKLGQLRVAISLGIDVPSTTITNSRRELLKFYSQHANGIINKSIGDSFMVTYEETTYSMFTEEVPLEMINDLPEVFCRSLFQEKLDKEFEVRSFFLKGEFYSMAIFSQKDTQTTVDFRRYNVDVPNRISRCLLPEELEEKTRKLMERLKLDTGSIDFVKTKDGRWVYLEVNPVGQFGMVSQPCNYQLERKIAEKLL